MNNHPDIVAYFSSLEAFVSLGAELVFVDSKSSDGTLEAITTFCEIHGGILIGLPHGLYAAWNAGVEAASRKWITFGTVGDTQTVQGLQHFIYVSKVTQADVVVSPPGARRGKIAIESR